MIGSHLAQRLLSAGINVVGVDRFEAKVEGGGYRHCVVDLGDAAAVEQVFQKHKIDRVIHLAALAHRHGEPDLSIERYIHVNVECSKNVFAAAEKNNASVLYISTIDVFGFTRGTVTAETVPHPVTSYAKTKLMAEEECKNICTKYSIFRLSPVYTPEIKRDIQKRYYLKSPKYAYTIGKGGEYEVLDVAKATERMLEWCAEEPDCKIHIIKDDMPMVTSECIKAEKAEGRAKHVIYCPRWIAVAGFHLLKCLTGKNKYTYLLSKAIYPLKTQ